MFVVRPCNIVVRPYNIVVRPCNIVVRPYNSVIVVRPYNIVVRPCNIVVFVGGACQVPRDRQLWLYLLFKFGFLHEKSLNSVDFFKVRQSLNG